MLRLYSKNKAPLVGLAHYKDLCIEGSLGIDSRKLSFSVPLAEAAGLENECYLRTREDWYVVKSLVRDGAEIQVGAALDMEALEGNAFRSFKSTEQPIDKALALAFAGSGWLVENHGVTKKRTLSMSYTDALKILKQAIKTYRVEARADSLAKKIHIYPQVGEDRGAYLTSQLNLKKLGVQSTSYDFYTRIEPYGKDGMTIADANGGSVFLEDHSYSGKVKTYIWKDERYTVPASLKEDARYKLDDLCRPYTAYTAEVANLAEVSGTYAALAYGLGDTVTLVDAASGTKVKQRIVSMKRYPDEPRRDTCQVANRRLTFEEMASTYADASDTVQNITNDNGEVDGDAIDGIYTKQIRDFGEALIGGIDASGKFHDLEAKYLEVTGKLTAVEAEFGKVKATYLTATQADIKYLKVEEARIKYATIEEAQINHAKITNLEAVTGQITTLLSGNAGIGELHNIHLTSKNAVIESALITDAVVKSLTVADLLAGDISTNRFRIVSDDGGILISGATQQWKDAAGKVRMQAGKDAQGNFTFSLFDATGKGALIDTDGIHADAVPDGLVVDAMVSGEAHIAGGKLNISSVVEEINGSTSSIKSARVLFDDTGQTLSVAFKAMATQVGIINTDFVNMDGVIRQLENVATAQETSISVMQGRIGAMISDAEFSELENGKQTLYSRFHSVEATLGGYESVISSLRTTVRGVQGDVGSMATNVSAVESRVNAMERDASSFKSTISSSVTTLDGRVASAESKITQLSGEIDLKVNKNGLIGQINNSGESIKISANRIGLTGNGVISLVNNSGTTTISAQRINLNGAITANKSFKISTGGVMTCIGGYVGGFTIADTYLKSGDASNGMYIYTKGFNNSSAIRIYSNGEATLGINYDGYMVASNAKIKGEIQTTQGDYFCSVKDGKVLGGVGSTVYGYIDYSSRIIDLSTGAYLKTLNLYGRDAIGIYTSKTCIFPSYGSLNGVFGGTGTIQVITNIRNIGGGAIEWTAGRYTFRHGYLISDP